MAAAVDQASTRGPGPVILIGTVCPTRRPAHLRAATAQLSRGCDVVLGPGHDGGYYLIGLARPAPRVFAIAPSAWGGADVTAATVDAAARIGLMLGFLDPEHDLDTPYDVAAILPDPPAGRDRGDPALTRTRATTCEPAHRTLRCAVAGRAGLESTACGIRIARSRFPRAGDPFDRPVRHRRMRRAPSPRDGCGTRSSSEQGPPTIPPAPTTGRLCGCPTRDRGRPLRERRFDISLHGIGLTDARTGRPARPTDLSGVSVVSLIRHRF